MAKIEDLKGFCYPLSPKGKCSILGAPPWHYGTEYLNFVYRVDPEEVRKWVPEPLELGDHPDIAYVAFSKWWSVWESDRDMPVINPERTQYKEAAIWVGCSYKGEQAQMCLPIWVDNDFTMARGWMMGFAKKLGQIAITDYNPYNPAMPEKGIGVRLTGIVSSHGERLIRGTMTIERQISPAELPAPIGRPLIHLRHFPSLLEDGRPRICELVKLGAINRTSDPVVWAGKGELQFYPSELEEHIGLAPREVLGAYWFRNGYTFDKAQILYDYTKEKK
ncbi:MAG: acetoacetate decarboxylase family protein [Pyramidobacter sp.]|jgi:acetoacetate decarboxylase